MPSVEALNELLRGISILPDARRPERSEEERLFHDPAAIACFEEHLAHLQRWAVARIQIFTS